MLAHDPHLTTERRRKPRRSVPVVAVLLLLLAGLAGRTPGTAASQEEVPRVALAWGSNGYGQLGDGTTADQITPVPVSVAGDMDAVAAGESYSLFLCADGTVWAAGTNWAGQLGDGTTMERHTPVPVSGLTGVDALSAGIFHNLAVKSDGTLWAWGANPAGELGDGTTTQRETPVQVHGLTEVVGTSAGEFHSLALRRDGTVWAWGWNLYGQLGDGTAISHLEPVQVQGLKDVVAIVAGTAHSVALRGDGTVWAWGVNARGELGDGTSTNRATPVPVTGLTTIAGVSTGSNHTLAVTTEGTVYAWGLNWEGQLGDGTTTNRQVPVPVSGLGDVEKIEGGYRYSIAVKRDGSVWGWGSNSSGQLGDGSRTDSSTPVPSVVVTETLGISAGGSQTLAVTTTMPWGLSFETAAYSAAEPMFGNASVTLTVSRGRAEEPCTVDYAAVPGGTATAGEDFAPLSGTLSFAARETSRSFNLSVFADGLLEEEETVSLRLSNPGNTILGVVRSTRVVLVDNIGATAPTQLRVSATGSDRAALSWRDSCANETGFQIGASDDDGASWSWGLPILPAEGIGETVHGITGPVRGDVTYLFSVRALRDLGDEGVLRSDGAETVSFRLRPPAAPTDFAAKTLSSGRVGLTWTDRSEDEASFLVQRYDAATDHQEPLTVRAAVGTGSKVTYLATGLLPVTTYRFTLWARNAAGASEGVGPVEVTTHAGLTAPSELTATALSPTRIRLTWRNNAAGVQSFYLERSTDGGASYPEVFHARALAGGSVSYVNPNLTPGTAYTYRVCAHEDATVSDYTGPASATTQTAPTAPTDLMATAVGGPAVRLTWTDHATNESRFQVEVSTDGGATYPKRYAMAALPGSGGTQRCRITHLTHGTTYTFRVRAYNDGAASAYSNPASATP
jgi:alpha-tubulin suppressor-like RCC1 family protein